MVSTPRHLLDKTIAVTRPTTSLDAGGGVISTFTAHLTAVAARIQPLGANENIRAGRPAGARTFRIYVAATTNIAATDRLTFGSRTFRILGPLVTFDEQNCLSRIEAEEI